MKNILLLAVMGYTILCAQGWTQAQEQKADDSKVLTNKDVVDMLSSGLPADIVAAKVKTSKCSFDTSVPALNTLRAEKVPDAVILAMVEAPHFAPIADDGRTRVFVTDSQSWETYGYSWFHGGGSVNGGTGSFSQNGGSASGGGARPQTVEIIKTLGERCPDITVTNQPDRANYVITLDHEGGKGLLRRRNKVALFNRNGDALYSHSTITLGDSVKDVCDMMHSDINGHPKAATN